MTRGTGNQEAENRNTLLRAVTDASGLSRRKAFAAIRGGRVTLNGVTHTEPSSPFGAGALALDGNELRAPTEAKTYLILNKPPGFITTASDELRRRTVLDLVPARLRAPGLHSVGRLDRDTSGLLLLTNDGDLTFRLTHPRHEVEKEYWVRLTQPPTRQQLEALRRGVELDGRVRVPVAVEPLLHGGPFDLSVTIREGRNRQVRRMVEAVGNKATALRRVREGPVDLLDLPEGAVRELSPSELQALRGE